jgi:hypothetical protein
MKLNVIGIDLAKNNFHLCGLDHKGKKGRRAEVQSSKIARIYSNHPTLFNGD